MSGVHIKKLKTLPSAFEYDENDGPATVKMEWIRHRGWWLVGEDEEDCHGDENCSIVPGRPVYLTGEDGVMYCIHHAPVKPPPGVK